jgi:phenylacetate-CoA ligase
MTEVGPVTHECPAQAGLLHVMENGYLAEIINPASGKPVSPGETGELVLTTLLRTGSPLVRYRTGDLVKARLNAPVSDAPGRVGDAAPCACGRHTLVLEGGILGRADDMVIVRGVNVFPSAVEELLRSCPGLAEYRVTISSSGASTEMSVLLEPQPEMNGKTLASLAQKKLQNAFALRVPVQVVSPGALPRFEMKAKRWVKECVVSR